MSRIDVVEFIESQFREQGGTGYSSLVEFDGCRCAYGVLTRTEGGMRFVRELDCRDLMVLVGVHDSGIIRALQHGKYGLVGDGVVRRALLGTPAYDYVVGEMRTWARNER